MPECSQLTKGVATLSMIYAGACVVYLVLTYNVGTPFKDSLTEDQIRIKRESVHIRAHSFYMGVAVSAMVVLCMRPFG